MSLDPLNFWDMNILTPAEERHSAPSNVLAFLLRLKMPPARAPREPANHVADSSKRLL